MRLILLLLAIPMLTMAAEPVEKTVKFYANNGTKEWCATAFFVTPTQLLTAAHTLAHTSKNVFILRHGKIERVRVVKVDYNLDAALVECDVPNAEHYALSDNGVVKAVGYAHEERALTTNPGIVTQVEASALLVDGMSGCPLVNSSGVVVGMGVSGDERKHPCYAVPSDALVKFMQK